MKQLIALAAAAVLLSACTLYQSPSDGRYTLVPGYNYSHEPDDQEPVIAPDGMLRPF